jgi:hypothetical protein
MQVTSSQDDDHWNITTNPLDFHYTNAYMGLLNSLPGAMPSTFAPLACGPQQCCRQYRLLSLLLLCKKGHSWPFAVRGHSAWMQLTL